MVNITVIEEEEDVDVEGGIKILRNYIEKLNQQIYQLESLSKEQQYTIKQQKEQIRDLEFPHFKNEGNPNGEDKVITYCNHCEFSAEHDSYEEIGKHVENCENRKIFLKNN